MDPADHCIKAHWICCCEWRHLPVQKNPHCTPGYCLCSCAISSLMCFTARAAKYRSLLAFRQTSRSAAKLLRFVSTVPRKPKTAAATCSTRHQLDYQMGSTKLYNAPEVRVKRAAATAPGGACALFTYFFGTLSSALKVDDKLLVKITLYALTLLYVKAMTCVRYFLPQLDAGGTQGV